LAQGLEKSNLSSWRSKRIPLPLPTRATAPKNISPKPIKITLNFISLIIGTAKNIPATIQQYIIVVPRSGCKNIRAAITRQIAIGKRLFVQLSNFF